MTAEIVKIARLGHAGDGVTADGLFVPFAVPGDRVRIVRDGGKARLIEVVSPGPDRITPACAHFGTCGGCRLQHVASPAYLAFKRERVVDALAQRGFAEAPVEAVRTVAPGTRRRAVFKLRGGARGGEIGFYARDSRTFVPIGACPVLAPALVRCLDPLRTAFGAILRPGETAEAHVTQADNGIDCSLRLKRARSPDLLAALAELAARVGLLRLSWNGEQVCAAAEPFVRVGRFEVVLPAEAFLQPTREGEAILQALVADGVDVAEPVADLFAGCGTFTLTLAGRAVHAVEGDGALVAALEGATHDARLTTERRDLFRRPLMADELARFAAVVLDPPRPGARAQAAQLAASAVPRVVYVSCNPASFARDARILADGGYRLRRVVPVDQFLWSAHVELAAVLER